MRLGDARPDRQGSTETLVKYGGDIQLGGLGSVGNFFDNAMCKSFLRYASKASCSDRHHSSTLVENTHWCSRSSRAG